MEASSSVMLPPSPTLKLAAPVTVCVPLSVMSVPALIIRISPTLTVPRSIALASVIDTALAPLLLRLTAPPKSLVTSVKVISPAPALKLALPVVVMVPDWVIPTPVTLRFATVTVPRSIALTSTTVTVPALLLRLTAPVKSLAALSRVIALAPALKLEAPAMVSALLWVIAPPALIVNAPVPTDTVPN